MSERNYDVICTPMRLPSGVAKLWTRGVGELEAEARRQIENAASMPFVFKHVAVMPDAHWGNGACIGSVIPTRGAIIPAAVGVDLGCGMMAVRTGLHANDLPDNLAGVRSAIEQAVPHGRTSNGGRGDRGAWQHPPEVVQLAWIDLVVGDNGFNRVAERHPHIEKANTVAHLGTLGTGNHFIEVCLDESDLVWVMLHSGSRGIGNRIGSYFIEKAKEDMRRWFINLPDENLAYLPEGSEFFGDYVRAVSWAQEFARVNRLLMMKATLGALATALDFEWFFYDPTVAVQCHHNYIAKENHFGENVWVTRKGAVRAREGELGIIPGAMGRKSFIVRGKGNPESFMSCSHGAGRKMSRSAAKKKFTVEDHAKATAGLECRKDADVIDETPDAYKDIDAVMAAQSDLVEIVHTLRAVVCVKG